MSAVDPAELQAHARAQLGLSRELEQARRVTSHPSHGGGGYDVWFRKEQLARAQAGEDVDVSVSSIHRWGERLHPYRQTGNKAREQVVGVDLIILVTFLRAWPQSTLDEMAVVLYNKGGPLYSKRVLSGRLAELSITKKRASPCWCLPGASMQINRCGQVWDYDGEVQSHGG